MAQKMFGDALKKGEEIFQSVSGKLLEKPAVAKALEAAMVGKSKVDQGVATAFKRMNVQSRSEFRGVKARVDSLEMQLAELREEVEAMKATRTSASGAKPRARKAATKRSAKKA